MAEVSCCEDLVKYILFIINFFLFASGVAVIAVGALIHVGMNEYGEFLTEIYADLAIALIVIGVIIVVVGFFGCCGICTDSSCMIFTFTILLGAVVLAEIGVVAFAFTHKTQTEDVIRTEMFDNMKVYDKDDDAGNIITLAWDNLQMNLKCCGVDNYTNWDNFLDDHNVPDTCCLEKTENCGSGMINNEDPENSIYITGCFTKLKTWFEDNSNIILGIGAGVILIQVIGVLITCLMGNNMRRRENYV